jgi:hypothetical protein
MARTLLLHTGSFTVLGEQYDDKVWQGVVEDLKGEHKVLLVFAEADDDEGSPVPSVGPTRIDRGAVDVLARRETLGSPASTAVSSSSGTRLA